MCGSDMYIAATGRGCEGNLKEREHGRRRKDNIAVDVKGVGRVDVSCIQLSQDTEKF